MEVRGTRLMKAVAAALVSIAGAPNVVLRVSEVLWRQAPAHRHSSRPVMLVHPHTLDEGAQLIGGGILGRGNVVVGHARAQHGGTLHPMNGARQPFPTLHSRLAQRWRTHFMLRANRILEVRVQLGAGGAQRPGGRARTC